MKIWNKRKSKHEESLRIGAKVIGSMASRIESSFDPLLRMKCYDQEHGEHFKAIYWPWEKNLTAIDKVEIWGLQSELKNLEQYVAIWQELNPTNCFVKFQNKIPSNLNLPIATVIGIPLIKNALHRGYNSIKEFPVRIKLSIAGRQLKLEVSNHVNHHLIDQADDKSLEIFQDRLNFLYPGRHNLLINSNTKLHKAVLLLEL